MVMGWWTPRTFCWTKPALFGLFAKSSLLDFGLSSRSFPFSSSRWIARSWMRLAGGRQWKLMCFGSKWHVVLDVDVPTLIVYPGFFHDKIMCRRPRRSSSCLRRSCRKRPNPWGIPVSSASRGRLWRGLCCENGAGVWNGQGVSQGEFWWVQML